MKKYVFERRHMNKNYVENPLGWVGAFSICASKSYHNGHIGDTETM